MKKSLRLLAIFMLAAFMFAMNASAITILGGSSEEKLLDSGWTLGTVGFTVKLDEPIDISGMDNLYFRMYIDSADNIFSKSNGQLELTSGGTCDVEESNINPVTLDWVDGWNEFVIPISDFVGDCDFTRFNYVRLYMFTDETASVNYSALDYVAVGNEGDDLSVLVKTDWTLEEKPDPNAKRPDVVTLEAKGKGSPFTAVMDNSWGDSIDLSAYESAYIGVYVSNMDNYSPSHGGGQIEFGSGYSCDIEEDSQDVTALYLETGWNYFEVPLYMIVGGCDWAEFDHFRIYMFFDTPNEEVETKIDYVAFGPEGMDVAEGLADSFPYVLIRPLAEREAEAAAAAAAAEANGSTEDPTTNTEEPASNTNNETPVQNPTNNTPSTPSAPSTADFGIATSAVLFAAACVAVGVIKKKR